MQKNKGREKKKLPKKELKKKKQQEREQLLKLLQEREPRKPLQEKFASQFGNQMKSSIELIPTITMNLDHQNSMVPSEDGLK